MNILLYAPLSRLNNKAVEWFLEEHYSDNNVLIYEFLEACEFKPKIKKDHIYCTDLMREHDFRKIKDYYVYTPIEEKLLDAMAKYEGEIYKMMDTYFPPLKTFDDRQRTYYNALRFLNGLLEKNDIEYYIMFGIPHQIFDFIIYCLCKCKCIKTIMTYRLPITGYTYYMYDIRQHLVNDKKVCCSTAKELSPDFLESYNTYSSSDKGVQLYYMSNGSLKQKLHLFAERARQFQAYKQGVEKFVILYKLYRRKRQIDRYIKKISMSPDFSRKYLYMGLHYQPEGTTSPLAGIFVNQQLILQMLSYMVPDDVFIYVKEHPSQRFRGEKNLEFYKEISELRNVIVVPTSVSTNELEKNCIAVVTCTGTLAYEAMYKRKPALLFGFYIYNYIPGAFTIRNADDCQKAIKEVLKGVNITDQMILDYMYTLDKLSYHAEYGLPFEQFMQNQGVSLENNNKTNYQMLNDALNEAYLNCREG